MLRYRAQVIAALVMASVAAGSLGAGLVGIGPILERMLGKEARTLPEMAAEYNLKHSPQIPQGLIDILPTGQASAVSWIMGGLCVLTVFGATATFLHAYLSLTVVNRATTNIRREAFHRVLRMPLKDIVVGGPSDIISRIMQDTSALSGGFNSLLSKAVPQFFKGVGALIAAFFIDSKPHTSISHVLD